MFRSELYQLEKFIGGILDSVASPENHVLPDLLAEQLKATRSLCWELREAWVKQLLSTVKEQVLRRIIQYQQAGITQLSNRVVLAKTALKQSAEKDRLIYSFYESLSAELEDLLAFLNQRFYQYFDRDAMVTTCLCHRELETLSAYHRQLFLHPSPDIDPGLVYAVKESITEMLAEAQLEGTSYRRLETVARLLHIVQHALQVIIKPSSDLLARALYKGNLNTLHFMVWYQEHLQREMGKLPGKQKKEEFIRTELKGLSIIFIDPDKSFESELPPVDQQLLPWLQSQLEETGRGNGDLFTKPSLNARLPLVISVPQFAMFVRIFQKTGCFTIHNAARIMRFFTQHFTTKKQVNISIKSFNHAFYSMDQSTAAVVRDYLQQMINYVNKSYFPK